MTINFYHSTYDERHHRNGHREPANPEPPIQRHEPATSSVHAADDEQPARPEPAANDELRRPASFDVDAVAAAVHHAGSVHRRAQAPTQCAPHEPQPLSGV